MKTNSYLLALDGSAESRAAAYLAWDLAKKTGAKVVAQHVINTRDTWDLLRPKSTGFIGSGVYIDALERVKGSLSDIAEALMISYRAQCEEQCVDFETHIDEGDIAAEICKRAKEHDLLIIGHRVSRAKTTGQIANYSLCEELTDVCPCPMLILTSSCDQSRKMRISIGSGTVDLTKIKKLSEFGRTHGLPIELHISRSIAAAKAKALLKSLSRCCDSSSWGACRDSDEQGADSQMKIL